MTFNPESFLDATFTDAFDTTFEPIPVGEYQGTIDSIKFANGVSDKGPWARLDVTWSLNDPALAERLGRKKVTCRQGIMLDLSDSGNLDSGKGRNISLGRLRDALDLNITGQPFSFRMLEGRSAKVNVTQRMWQDKIQNDVKDVARL